MTGYGQAEDQPLGHQGGLFVRRGKRADVAVLIVTFNSANHIEGLVSSLRAETARLRLRVVVADNASTDGTLNYLRNVHPDVVAFSTGGNLGYSAGVNAALSESGHAATVLVLNPDLTVAPGALEIMFRTVQNTEVGAVVPRLLNNDGTTGLTLHREPSVLRATGDALFGRRFSHRPGWLAGSELNARGYETAHTVDWATGAALMVRTDVAESLPWDESFFLYSEETDFFRRLRACGLKVVYEPQAIMTHSGRGSGASPALNALMAVNRIRYVRKHHHPAYSGAFRAAVVLAEALRLFKPGREGLLRIVANESTWAELPAAAERKRAGAVASGTAIIPAHNEASVIARTLAPLARPASNHSIEVIVVCNGCTDRTADIARSFAGVKVLELPTPSKAAALNAGDAAATRWPRLYLDADVEISASAVSGVFEALATSSYLAVRPQVQYDLTGANPLIRSFYRTRQQLPSVRTALWAAGVYGISRKGHERFTTFPELLGDDLFIDRLFSPDEKAVVDVEPVVFRPPRTLKDLFSVLRRVYRGNAQQNGAVGLTGTAWNTLAELLRSVRGPVSAVHAVIYLYIASIGRRQSQPPGAWERDESSRQPPALERYSA